MRYSLSSVDKKHCFNCCLLLTWLAKLTKHDTYNTAELTLRVLSCYKDSHISHNVDKHWGIIRHKCNLNSLNQPVLRVTSYHFHPVGARRSTSTHRHTSPGFCRHHAGIGCVRRCFVTANQRNWHVRGPITGREPRVLLQSFHASSRRCRIL